MSASHRRKNPPAAARYEPSALSHPEEPTPSRSFARALVRAGTGLLLLLFVLYALELDVALGIGRGRADGWITLDRQYRGYRETYVFNAVGWPAIFYVPEAASARTDPRPRWFTLVTPDAAERIERLQATRPSAADPPLAAVYPTPPQPVAMTSQPVKAQGRLFGRLRYAGFLRQVVYDFQELPAP